MPGEEPVENGELGLLIEARGACKLRVVLQHSSVHVFSAIEKALIDRRQEQYV